MKKTKEHKRILRENRMWPLLWEVLWERTDRIVVHNRITGSVRVLDK